MLNVDYSIVKAVLSHLMLLLVRQATLKSTDTLSIALYLERKRA